MLVLLLVAGERVAEAQDGETLTLAGALAMARARSADVRAAQAQEDAADAAADAALAGYLPSLSGQVGASQTSARVTTHERESDVVGRAVIRQHEVSAALRWNIFDFGQTPSRVGAARASARAAEQRRRTTTNETLRSVATAYLVVAFDELLVENAKLTAKIRERHALISKAQAASGVRPTVDEARARVEFELARLDVIALERQMAQDRVQLATLLLLPPVANFKITRPQLRIVNDDPNASARIATERHPAVHAGAEEVVAREEELSAASYARLPTLGVSLEAANRAPVGSDRDIRYPSDASLTARATLTIPIFDWHVWGQVPVARENVSAAMAERDGIVARVRGAAAQAAYAVQAAKVVVEQARSTRELAGATLAVLEGRYQAGLATSTDLFDAAGREADARRVAIRAELELATATVQALAATNRLGELER
jgi:outer membrane protein TolC